MTDYFAVLGLPRRPALDPVVLKEKYLRLAAGAHPDAGGTDEEFRAVQAAYKTLLDPASRLRHLSELEFGSVEKKSAPVFPDLFMKVGEALQHAKAFRARMEKTSSPLARALLAQDRQALLDQLQAAAQAVEEALQVQACELETLDARWPGIDAVELSRVAAGFAFLSRWRAEISEAVFQFAHAEVAS